MKLRTIFFVAILVLVTGCARHCGRMAYDKEIHRQVSQFEFDASPEKVWAETLGVFDEYGTTFSDRSLPVDEASLSDWEGPAGHQTRYSVRVLPTAERRSRLQIHRIQQVQVPIYADAGFDPDAGPREPIGHRQEIDRVRDFTIEWEVIQRSAPSKAMEIEQAARERQEVVQDVVASGCT